MTDAEDIAEMEMPCQCDCGEFFDLNDGNPCNACMTVTCTECTPEPFALCPNCAAERGIEND